MTAEMEELYDDPRERPALGDCPIPPFRRSAVIARMLSLADTWRSGR